MGQILYIRKKEKDAQPPRTGAEHRSPAKRPEVTRADPPGQGLQCTSILGALWSLLDGGWGVLKGSLGGSGVGMLRNTGVGYRANKKGLQDITYPSPPKDLPFGDWSRQGALKVLLFRYLVGLGSGNQGSLP